MKTKIHQQNNTLEKLEQPSTSNKEKNTTMKTHREPKIRTNPTWQFLFVLLTLVLATLPNNVLKAQCDLDNPATLTQAYDLVDAIDCCVSQIEVYDFGGEPYFWLPYDVDNCPLDGPQYSYLYDCALNEICYTEDLSDITTCDALGFVFDGNGTIIWQNNCINDPCVDPYLIDLDLGCDDIYAPVCGCNGLTYENECVAQTIGGIIDFTEGACGSTTISDCNLDIDIIATFVEGYGTDDEPQSFAAEIYDFHIVMNEPVLDYMEWDFGNGQTATGGTAFGIEFTTIENGVPQGPFEVCFTAGNSALPCETTTCETFEFGGVELGTASISGNMWLDVNADGVMDAGEVGFSDMLVFLIHPNGTEEEAIVNADGEYLFDNLPAGEYTVEVLYEEPPFLTTQEEYVIDLGIGEDYTDADFGFHIPELGSIGDYVWLDANADQIQDPGEEGIPGVVVTLTYPDGTVEEMVTGPDGEYLFEDLPSGEYIVTVGEGPEGTELTTPGEYMVALAEGEDYVDADFGFDVDEFGSISGTTWLDPNANQIIDAFDLSSAGTIAGVTITLTHPDGSTQTTVSNADSEYTFDNLPLGLYTVTVGEGPESTYLTTPGNYFITLNEGEDHEGANFGFDDCAEQEFIVEANTEIIVCPDLCILDGALDGQGNIEITNAVSANNGLIALTGDNCIAFTPLTVEFDTLALTACASTTGDCVDFEMLAFVQPNWGGIGDFVFADYNANGLFDDGDDPLEGAEITLYDDNGDELMSTVTDEEGYYLFDPVFSGEYTVEITLQTGWTPTTPNIVNVTVEGFSLADADFGIVQSGPGTITGGVLYDSVTGTDLWLPGLEVTLTHPDGTEESILSDEDGVYVFENLPIGEYTVTMGEGPEDYYLTFPYEYTFFLSGGQVYDDANFSFVTCTQQTYTVEPLSTNNFCLNACPLSGQGLGSIEITEVNSLFDCSITIGGDNCITYMPLPAFTGTDILTVTFCAVEYVICEEIEVIVITEAPFQAPNLQFSILPGEQWGIDLNNYIAANNFELTLLEDPAFGTISNDGTVISYVPDDGFLGADVFNYEITDIETEEVSTGTITIVVESDVTPTLDTVEDYYYTNINNEVSICPLENDIIVTIGFELDIENPSIGELTDDVLGCYTYTPPTDYTGIVTIAYSICYNVSGECDNAEITIYVQGSTEMVAVDDYESTNLNTEVVIEALNNDSPVSNAILEPYTVSVIETSQNGELGLSILEDCINPGCEFFIYTPDLDFEGSDQFTYSICNDAAQCDTATVYISVGVDCSEFCVWPGDANNDGSANNYDILALGLLYGEMGPVRPDATIEWTPQQAFNWDVEAVQASPYNEDSMIINGKFADCNGDGVVSTEDGFAIADNYNFTHGKPATVSTAVASPSLVLSIQEEVVEPGTWVNLEVSLEGDLGEDPEDIYGIAFQIEYYNEYDGEPVIIADSVNGSFGDGWINNNGNDLVLTLAKNRYEIDQESTQIDFAVSRTNKQGVDGSGLVGVCSALITQNITGKTAFDIPLNFFIRSAYIMYDDGTMLPMENSTVATQLEVTTGISELPYEYSANVDLYPNPADRQLYLSIPKNGFENVRLESIHLYNMFGQEVWRANGELSEEIIIDVAAQAEGIYYLNIQTDKGSINRKIEIMH